MRSGDRPSYGAASRAVICAFYGATSRRRVERSTHAWLRTCYRFGSGSKIIVRTAMSSAASIDRIARHWDAEIVPQLVDYVRIPAKSPLFDPAWEANGHIEKVITLAERWARAQPVRGLVVEIVRLQGRTPVLLFEVPATDAEARGTVLLYGHL